MQYTFRTQQQWRPRTAIAGRDAHQARLSTLDSRAEHRNRDLYNIYRLWACASAYMQQTKKPGLEAQKTNFFYSYKVQVLLELRTRAAFGTLAADAE